MTDKPSWQRRDAISISPDGTVRDRAVEDSVRRQISGANVPVTMVEANRTSTHPIGLSVSEPSVRYARRILCADDNPVMLTVLEAALTNLGYEVTLASNGEDAWQKLAQARAPRLAILDWMMPGMDGPEVVRKVREEGQESYTYLILLTARSGKSDILQGMACGADDYITKPFDMFELEARVRAGQRILDLQAHLLDAQAELRRLASRDALTNLYNRGAIMRHLEEELNRGRRVGESVAVVILDLDHFKSVNDTHGHRIGDAVLRETARRVRRVLRKCDAIGHRVGRYGGEEFLIVLSDCGEEDARRVSERVREAIQSAPLCRQGVDVQLTASFGIAVSEWERPVDSDTLIEAADIALYRAKEGGRNQIAF